MKLLSFEHVGFATYLEVLDNGLWLLNDNGYFLRSEAKSLSSRAFTGIQTTKIKEL